MNRSVPSPLQRAIEAVFCSLNGRLVSQLGGAGWDPAEGKVVIDRLITFLRNNLAAFGDQPFGIKVLLEAQPSPETLSTTRIRNELASVTGTILVSVASDLSIVAIEPIPPESASVRWIDVMQEKSKSHAIFYLQSRHSLWVFGREGLVDEMSPATMASAPRTGRFGRPSAQYQDLIREHYEISVKHGDDCDHWHCTTNRYLRSSLGSCTKTEEIFQKELMRWLKNNLLDGQPWREPQKPNKDRADIKIQSLSGCFYFIEIKWLGKCGPAGSTKRTLTRLSSGLKQLEQYLTEPPCPRNATLVVYDARPKTQFESLQATDEPIEGMKIVAACNGQPIPPGGTCHVYFLFSDRASQL